MVWQRREILTLPLAACSRPSAGPPFLYAGEWPEDFRFLPPKRYGIAYWAMTVTPDGGGCGVRPRTETLFLPLEPAGLHAVARVVAREQTVTPQQRRCVSDAIARLAEVPRLSAIAVQFEGPADPAALLSELRARLPIPVSKFGEGRYFVHSGPWDAAAVAALRQ